MNDEKKVDEILKQLDERKAWALRQVWRILSEQPSIGTGKDKIFLKPLVKPKDNELVFDLCTPSKEWHFEFTAEPSGGGMDVNIIADPDDPSCKNLPVIE